MEDSICAGVSTMIGRPDWWADICEGADVDSRECPRCGGTPKGLPYSEGYDSFGDCRECGGSGLCEMSPPIGGPDCSEGA